MPNSKKNQKKLLLVCTALPPLVIGSPILLKNFFEDYPNEIEAVAGWEYGAKSDAEFQLPFHTTYLIVRPSLLQRFFEKLGVLYFPLVKNFVYREAKKSNCQAIFAACTPDGLFFTAAYLASKRLNLPFYAQMHDLWYENTKKGSFNHFLAQRNEKRILKEAVKVYCMTDVQMDFYRQKYPDRDFELLPHCVPKKSIELYEKTGHQKERRDGKIRILYTGNISHAMNVDALQDFVKAVKKLPPEYRVKMLIPLNKSQLKANKLYDERIEYDWVNVEKARKIMNDAHVLFLPLSFTNCSAKEVRTVYATKTLDYLTSKVPIFVYSPADSFHSISARKYGWGHVLDIKSPDKIREELVNLASNQELRKQVLLGAKEEMYRRDPRKQLEKLDKDLGKS